MAGCGKSLTETMVDAPEPCLGRKDPILSGGRRLEEDGRRSAVSAGGERTIPRGPWDELAVSGPQLEDRDVYGGRR